MAEAALDEADGQKQYRHGPHHMAKRLDLGKGILQPRRP
jgi:hypothetical protein